MRAQQECLVRALHEWKDWEAEKKMEQEKWLSEGAARALSVTMKASGGYSVAELFGMVIAKVLS